jgi:hypothetical protein
MIVETWADHVEGIGTCEERIVYSYAPSWLARGLLAGGGGREVVMGLCQAPGIEQPRRWASCSITAVIDMSMQLVRYSLL